MIADGHIGWKKAIILLDIGIEGTNHLSIDFESVHNLITYKYEESVSISMATKGSKTSSHYWTVQTVQFDNRQKIKIRFDIALLSIDKDTILGMQFL